MCQNLKVDISGKNGTILHQRIVLSAVAKGVRSCGDKKIVTMSSIGIAQTLVLGSNRIVELVPSIDFGGSVFIELCREN